MEEPANSESPPASPVGAAVAREREAAAAAEVGRPTTGVEAEAAAIAIQGRVRGAQARRRAAAKKLVLSRQGDAAEDTSRLDVDVGEWLEAHNEPDIADELRVDFDCDTLRDLLAIIQDPADCGMIIPDDPARCDALWKALQQEISEGLQALKSPVEPIRPEAPVIPPPGDSDLPTEFGLVHVSGLRGSLQEERHVKSLFSEFGTVQAVKLKTHLQPRKGASWALVTFMDSAEAQRAVDAALAINAKYPGVVTRKVDELPLPPQTGHGMLEIMKSHKRARVFTKDTQALVDTDAFVTEIGEDLPDDVAVRAMEATAAAAPTTCSCGAVHWPSCPLNPVHGDPMDFLRLRRMAKMTFAVAMVQAHWRGFTVRKKVARSQEGFSRHTAPPPPLPPRAAAAMGQPTTSGGGGAAAAADARAWRESSGAGGAAVPTGRNEALPEMTTAAAVAVRGDDPYDNIQVRRRAAISYPSTVASALARGFALLPAASCCGCRASRVPASLPA